MSDETAMSGAAPIELDDLLAPSWLAVHIPGQDEASITTVTVVEKVKTVATEVRFRIDHADGSARHLCVKGYFEDPGRQAPGTGRTEARSYQHLAPSLTIPIPRAVYAAFDETIPRSVIVMDDLVAGGSVFFSALSPFSVKQSLGHAVRSWAADYGIVLSPPVHHLEHGAPTPGLSLDIEP